VVETLSDKNGCGVSELAAELDLPKSTAYEYLRTLSEDGYLLRKDGHYVCSTKFLSIGVRTRQNCEIYSAGKSEVQSLAAEVNTHVALLIEENGFAIPIYIDRVAHSMDPVVPVGQPTYMHIHAAGKAILAELPPERVDEILDRRGLPKMTPNTITGREELFLELADIRDREIAVDRDEAIEGLHGIAVPVKNRESGVVLGSISLYGPASGKVGVTNQENLRQELTRTKNTIELNLIP
jgi:DNA-binding IclR family transcriptional regulator